MAGRKDKNENISDDEVDVDVAENANESTREGDYNERLRTMRGQYEQDRASMQVTTSKNHVINALMQEKNESRFGRLGDLGAVDAKYDVAVSTACGRLDNIVVDTVETAEACNQFGKLKQLKKKTSALANLNFPFSSTL